ncbi:MAG: EAL domain-containing protein [Oceanospirillales bacterium]|nr:EAL domain-containing protein [Oceanospirillales bacterium]
MDTDGKIHPCAAPSLPAEFGQAIEGESIGPAAGSCGTSAWRGEAVEVTDIATDPLWSTYKALALPLGLAACWSSPIKLRDGRVAATFALYYREKRSASEFHRKMVSACVHLCSLAIEHEHAEQHIHQLVFHDRLTGLPNLNLLKDRAQRALQATVYSGEPLTMMFLDLDHFKTVNESLGHQAGDRLLQEVARRLQSCIAAEDTLARLGGDEFVLLLSDTGAQKARALAEHLQVRLSDVIEGEATPFSMTASIGISIAPEDAIDFEMLHRNADIALYQAKAAGRNAIRFYQSHMNDAAQQHLIIASALRRAVSEQQLDVYYQPKIALDTGRLMGVEALVRWVDPELGSLPPDRFIPVAEETGLIAALDSYVMEKACRQLVSWQAQGVPVTSVAVNLSATEFRGGDIYQRIKSLVERLAIKPGMLTLEITESLMMEPGSDIHDELIRIRELGVGLPIDDFGTGFSSLSYLKRFPVTELKLDRSFVNDLGHDASDRALARAVIQLGATFGLQVVAEGVETRNQADILSQIGCTLAQGYYFAHPMPADQFEHWLAGDGQDYIE